MSLLDQLRDRAVELPETALPTAEEARPLLGALIDLLGSAAGPDAVQPSEPAAPPSPPAPADSGVQPAADVPAPSSAQVSEFPAPPAPPESPTPPEFDNSDPVAPAPESPTPPQGGASS